MMTSSRILCVLFLSIVSNQQVSHSRKVTSRKIDKIPKNDGKLAESLYLNCSDFIPEKVTTEEVDICGMSQTDFFNLCTMILNSPLLLNKNRFFSVAGVKPEGCKQYTTLLSHHASETPFINISARACPADPPLYVTKGHGNTSAFVLEHLYEGSPMLQFRHFAENQQR